MQSGRSVSSCTSGTAFAIRPTSSASGSPTLTSSMSAPPATCSATSTSTWDRSPACSCAWNALRPVGLMRSPMIVNGPSGLITTLLDRDSRTVCTRLPLLSRGDAETPAQACDAGLAAEADQVEPAHARQRARVVGELARELEALGFGVGGALAALDQLRRHLDPGHLLVDETQRRRRAHEADRRQQRRPLRQAPGDRFGQEALEQLRAEAHLQLQEPGARGDLLQRPPDTRLERRRAGVLDGAEEEARRRVDAAARQV